MLTKRIHHVTVAYRLRWSSASIQLVAPFSRLVYNSHHVASYRSFNRSISLRTRNAPGSREFSSSRIVSSQDASRGVRPLEGVTVVSLEQAVAAPYCSRLLADLGARVIKVERPEGGDFARHYDGRVDGLSSHFVWINRSKESLTLDLKQERDLAILKKLLTRADVLVQNLAPGASARLGLSYDALREVNSKLIVCDISGYGQYGPYKNKKAYDLLVQSESGVLSTTGTPDAPAKVGISISDIASGTFAYGNILAALLQRQKTGEGSNIDISMLESTVEWMGFPLYYTYKGAAPPIPAGASHASICPYGPFMAGDGKSVMLGIQNEREWVNFCAQVLKDPDLATDARFSNNTDRLQNRDALKDIIEKVFSALTAEEANELLDKAAIANATVNNMQDVWNHPQLQARGRWTQVDTEKGPIPALIPPGVPADTAHDGRKARMDPVPGLGQHTKAILAELGVDESS